MELIKFDKTQLNKSGALTFAENLETALDNGIVNPLELAQVFKVIETAKEKIKDKLSELSITEAEKYEGKRFNHNGNVMELSDSLGVKYDYSNCGSKEYEKVLKDLEPLLKRKGEIEKELQAMKKSREEVDTETGETYTVYPPIRKSTTGVKITLK